MKAVFKVWESEFFGVNLYELQMDENDFTDPRELMSHYPQSVWQANISSDDFQRLTLLLGSGFRWVSTTIGFAENLGGYPSTQEVLHEASAEDIMEIKEFLPGMYRYSRFGTGEFFHTNAADRLYDEWIQKAYEGSFDDGILVCRIKGNVGGFVTYKHYDTLTKIGLFGVNPKFTGLGIGSILIDGFESSCVASNVKFVVVETQQQNYQAMKLYAKKGYGIRNIKAWLYGKCM